MNLMRLILSKDMQAKICSIFLMVLIQVACEDPLAKNNMEGSHSEVPRNWTRLGPGGGGSTFIPTFSYHSEKEFFIRCDMTGAYHTKNGGSSYREINYPNGSRSFAYDPNNPNVLYIGANTLNRSVDGGKTWEIMYPFEEDIIKESFSGDHADYSIRTKENSLYNVDSNSVAFTNSPAITNIKVDPIDSNFIYFSFDDFFFHTQNGGKSWRRLKMGDKIDYIYTNSSDAKDKVLVFTASSVNVVDKKSWKASVNGYPSKMQPAFSITGGTVLEGKSSVFYGLHNDEPDPSHGISAPTELWISKDQGKTWRRNEGKVITNGSDPLPTYSTLAAAENDAVTVYVVTSHYEEKKNDSTEAVWYGTLKSSDSGDSWEWVWKGGGGSGKYGVRDGKDASNLKDAWVHEAFGKDFIRLIDVGVSPNNGNVAIVTDWYRSMKTVDGGKNWNAIYSSRQKDGSYTSNGLDVTTAYGVHFDPFDSTHIAISYTDIGYHHSFNQGKSWFRSIKGIPVEWQNTCYWIQFDPNIKNKLWSVWSSLHDFPRGKMTRNPKWKQNGKGGVAVSTDGGLSWSPTVEGMGFDTPATSIVLDKNSPVGKRTLYVAAYGKGVFKSIDDGKTWKLHNNGIKGSMAAFELTILPDGTLYLITSPTPQHTHDEEGREVFMGAVYRSTDEALSWKRLNVGEKTQFPNGLAYDEEDPSKLYLGSWSDIHLSDLVGGKLAEKTGGNALLDLDGGILMSEDGGDTWTRVFDENQYVYDVTVDSSTPGRVYCNTFNQGAYVSNDWGKTWKKIKDYDFHWGHRVIVDDANSENVYLTTFGSSVWYGKPETE
ncbi:sialidase family protein [Ulvibacterium sp.]|uniref:sialidase family protein n=1 Tax=Ulvibacterium sp. TaxID=2665914 RepID=UPI0026321E6E|nr:sialidase family protein [Ulvibacterium sp.]